MPRLLQIICEKPDVSANRDADCVQIEIKANGHLVERVGMRPHLALLVAAEITATALAMMANEAGAKVVSIGRRRGKGKH